MDTILALRQELEDLDKEDHLGASGPSNSCCSCCCCRSYCWCCCCRWFCVVRIDALSTVGWYFQYRLFLCHCVCDESVWVYVARELGAEKIRMAIQEIYISYVTAIFWFLLKRFTFTPTTSPTLTVAQSSFLYLLFLFLFFSTFSSYEKQTAADRGHHIHEFAHDHHERIQAEEHGEDGPESTKVSYLFIVCGYYQ